MKLVYLLTTCLVYVVVSVHSNSCSKADITLLQYIKWQMQSMKINGLPGKCTCRSTEKRIVAFQVRLEKNISNLSNYAVVKFERIITNIENAYDKGTGYFTCPEEGVYSFSLSFVTIPGKRFHTELVLDGDVIVYNYLEGSGSKVDIGSSHSAVAKLKNGDKVWIRARATHGHHAVASWSSFSGFKI